MWVASDIALLTWLKKKREGHVGECFLTAKMIHEGMYTWHTLTVGVMGRAQLLWEAFSLLDWQPTPTKGGRLPLFYIQTGTHHMTLKWMDNPDYAVCCTSQSTALPFIEHLLCTDTYLRTYMMDSINRKRRDYYDSYFRDFFKVQRKRLHYLSLHRDRLLTQVLGPWQHVTTL